MRRTGSAKGTLRTAAKEINLDGANKQWGLSISLRARRIFVVETKDPYKSLRRQVCEAEMDK